MIRRLLLTLSSAAWLTGMYLLYAHFISPLIEPAQLTAREPQAVALPAEVEEFQPGQHHAVATEFLPQQDWAKTAENQFKIGDMFLYANTVEQQSNNRPDQPPGQAEIRFKPFALVWKNPKGKPDDPPLRVTADAAVIRFESAIDISSQQASRPVWGALEGAVRIEGPNGLKIFGRGFTFDEQALRLWSDSDILFHYGPHHGTGHGLQVDFLPASESQVVRDQPRLGGLRTVSLLRQVVMNLAGEAATPDAPRRSPLKAGDRLTVESDGRMQYDLEASLITFDHRVRVRHPLPTKQLEGLNCDLLTLVLSKSKAASAGSDPSAEVPEIALVSKENEAPANQEGIEGWLPDSLNLEKLLADGTGKRRVELFSQSRELHCNTAQVEYDLAKRMVTLRDPVAVDVLQGTRQLHAPEVMLAFEENNRDIRLAIARGPGSAVSRMPDGRTVSAKWQKQLVKSSDPKSQLDIVEVQGEASISLDLEYVLSGDALRVWFTPVAMNNKIAEGPDEIARPAEKVPPPKVERVAGVGQVVLKSPQATAHTKWLDVRLKTVALPPAVPGSDGGLFGLQGEKPNPQGQRNGPRGKPLDQEPDVPLDVRADAIRALVARDLKDETRMALTELWADDAVTVTQPLKPGQPPVQMLGQHLHLESNSPPSTTSHQPPATNHQLLTLTGAPAQIRSDVSRLEGNDIRMDREQNTLHVYGPGVLQYPVKTALDGQPLERPDLLQVKWAERLEFNGQTADFYEKVEASVRQMVMRCNAMHVTLVNPVRFDDPQLRKLSAEQTQVSRIFCENKVEIDSAEYLGNIIISRSFGRLGQFVIDNVTGKTEAQGPGYFMEWRRGQQRAEARLNANKTAKSKSRQPTKPQEWTYSRIDFQGRMKGNVRDRFTTFEDHVEIVYGPVPHATDKFEADALPDGGAAITCNALKVEQYAETEAAPAFIKLSAEGNTKLELEWDGHPLHAQADEVKFDESKDYYLLRSIGNQKVIINREPTTEDPRGRIKCSRVDIFRSRREFKVHHATELNGLQQ